MIPPLRVGNWPNSLPLCGKCNKEVDSFEVMVNPICCWTEFVARCHGEEERVKVSDRDLIAAKEFRVEICFGASILKGDS